MYGRRHVVPTFVIDRLLSFTQREIFGGEIVAPAYNRNNQTGSAANAFSMSRQQQQNHKFTSLLTKSDKICTHIFAAREIRSVLSLSLFLAGREPRDFSFSDAMQPKGEKVATHPAAREPTNLNRGFRASSESQRDQVWAELELVVRRCHALGQTLKFRLHCRLSCDVDEFGELEKLLNCERLFSTRFFEILR